MYTFHCGLSLKASIYILFKSYPQFVSHWWVQLLFNYSIVHIWGVNTRQISHLSSVPLILIYVSHFRIIIIKKWYNVSTPITRSLRSKNLPPRRFQTALHCFPGTSPKQQRYHFLVKKGKKRIVLSNKTRVTKEMLQYLCSAFSYSFWNVSDSFLKI